MKEKESVEYLSECFDVVDGILYWSKTRPDGHFIGRAAYRARYFRDFAGHRVGCVKKDGKNLYYIYLKLNGRHYYAHQIIWALNYGYYASAIDHVDGDGLNNDLVNLEETDNTKNGRNKQRSSINTSGYTGVYWNKNAEKWQASVWIDGKCKHLGVFTDVEVAAKVAKQARDDQGFTQRHGQDL